MRAMATAHEATASADRIAGALEARRDELVAAAFDAIRARLPAYRDADPALAEDVAGTSATHHDLLCAVLRRGRPAEAARLPVRRPPCRAARPARGRARRLPRGVPLLPQRRLGRDDRRRARRAARPPTRRSPPRARCCATSTSPTTEASAAYLEAQQLLLADSDRIRRDLLEDLLAGRDPESAAGLAAARDAGLDGTARCARRRGAADRRRPRTTARCGARPTRSRRRVSGRRGAPPLAVTRHGEIVLVRAVAAGERPALVAPLERACAAPANGASPSPSG